MRVLEAASKPRQRALRTRARAHARASERAIESERARERAREREGGREQRDKREAYATPTLKRSEQGIREA